MAVGPGELHAAVNAVGVPWDTSTHFADASYAIPSSGYLRDTFPVWWREELKARGLGTWDTVWDCDDFAWTLYTDLRWAHFRTRKSQAEGIAVGVIYYDAEAREEGGGGGHAINVCMVDGEEVRFLEPQRAARGMDPFIELGRSEIDSAWFVHF